MSSTHNERERPFLPSTMPPSLTLAFRVFCLTDVSINTFSTKTGGSFLIEEGSHIPPIMKADPIGSVTEFSFNALGSLAPISDTIPRIPCAPSTSSFFPFFRKLVMSNSNGRYPPRCDPASLEFTHNLQKKLTAPNFILIVPVPSQSNFPL